MSLVAGQQQVIVRMPVALHEAIKSRAELEERSMAQTIRYALRVYLAAGSAVPTHPNPKIEEKQ